MSKVQKFIDDMGRIDYYVDENNIIYFKAEDIAKGLGFERTRIKNGKEYKEIRWERINQYISEFSFPPEVGENLKPTNIGPGDYIPENILYRLAMKASSDTAQKFQAWIADEVIPSIRKHGIYIDKDHDNIRSFGINVRLVEARAIKRLLYYAKEKHNIELDKDENYGKLSCYANKLSNIAQDARDEADSINLAICHTIEACIAVTINTLINLEIDPLEITRMTIDTLNKFVAKIKDESKKRKDKKKTKMSAMEVNNSIVKNYSKIAKKHIFDIIETR